MFNLPDGVQVADVVAATELRHVTVQVFGTELVKRVGIGPRENRPEGLRAVGLSLVQELISDRVPDCFVVGQSVVGQGIAVVAVRRVP